MCTPLRWPPDGISAWLGLSMRIFSTAPSLVSTWARAGGAEDERKGGAAGHCRCFAFEILTGACIGRVHHKRACIARVVTFLWPSRCFSARPMADDVRGSLTRHQKTLLTGSLWMEVDSVKGKTTVETLSKCLALEGVQRVHAPPAPLRPEAAWLLAVAATLHPATCRLQSLLSHAPRRVPGHRFHALMRTQHVWDLIWVF